MIDHPKPSSKNGIRLEGRLLERTTPLDYTYQAEILNPMNADHENRIHDLLDLPGIQVTDDLQSQLMEWVKLSQPKIKFSKTELEENAKNLIEGHSPAYYGVWVFYPWSRRLVHLLPEDQFILVRTNRNQFKITPEEREILSTKKIGVLGLSVGQSVSITLAMERAFGELRLADFDLLELSNLNRIRSGVQDLGLLKTLSTARQIAEIDPFLNVQCFHEGVHTGNLDAFLTEGGALDILVDECDGLDIKILCRQRAKHHRIPVVMETSDGGMVDIERFDLEPNRPIMHGLIEHLDQNPAHLKGLSNEQKIPYILPMLGIETMTDRLKASMLEVEQSITTWPQLASDVVLGGAIAANVCRRMSLGLLQGSGRFFVDLNQLIREDKAYIFPELAENSELETPDEAIWQSLTIGNHFDHDGEDLPDDLIQTLIEAAIAAPSGGNNQPWLWEYQNRQILLRLDTRRTTSFLDYNQAGSILSLGCAGENLIIKAWALGMKTVVEVFPDSSAPELAAIFRFYKSSHPRWSSLPEYEYPELEASIPQRLTNRLLRKRVPLADSLKSRWIRISSSISGCDLDLITDPVSMEQAAIMMSKVDRLLITHPEGHHGFVHEIRWSDEEAKRTGDGIDLATLDLTAGEAAGFRMAKSWSVVQTLNHWGGGGVFEKMAIKAIAGASAVGLLSSTTASSSDYFNAGRALERLWLDTHLHSFTLQPMTAITFMLYRLRDAHGAGYSEKHKQQLTALSNDFERIFPSTQTHHPVFLMRFLQAEEPKVKSYRRPITNILKINR